MLENILKEQIFEKYPGILLQPEKDFVAVVNLSEPEHDEKEIRSLIKDGRTVLQPDVSYFCLYHDRRMSERL